MSDYKVGDEVRVFADRRHPNVEGGYPGKVTKVGRKYGTAEYEVATQDWRGNPGSDRRTIEFSLDDGRERGSSSYYAATVRTTAQVAEDRRHRNAVAVLAAAGIEFRAGRERRFTLGQVEALAEVVKGWED
jgi:hypothetical protein